MAVLAACQVAQEMWHCLHLENRCNKATLSFRLAGLLLAFEVS